VGALDDPKLRLPMKVAFPVRVSNKWRSTESLSQALESQAVRSSYSPLALFPPNDAPGSNVIIVDKSPVVNSRACPYIDHWGVHIDWSTAVAQQQVGDLQTPTKNYKISITWWFRWSWRRFHKRSNHYWSSLAVPRCCWRTSKRDC
jgi:hypothetical protein